MERPRQGNRTADADRMPQPVRDDTGATDPGPRDPAHDRENRGLIAPPETDSGTVPNLKFSFSDAHNRLEEGGWAPGHGTRAAGRNDARGREHASDAAGQNTGDGPLCFLEMFRSDRYADVSLNQWLALTPPGLVRGPPERGRRADGRAALRKEKRPVVEQDGPTRARGHRVWRVCWTARWRW